MVVETIRKCDHVTKRIMDLVTDHVFDEDPEQWVGYKVFSPPLDIKFETKARLTLNMGIRYIPG